MDVEEALNNTILDTTVSIPCNQLFRIKRLRHKVRLMILGPVSAERHPDVSPDTETGFSRANVVIFGLVWDHCRSTRHLCLHLRVHAYH